VFLVIHYVFILTMQSEAESNLQDLVSEYLQYQEASADEIYDDEGQEMPLEEEEEA
jgi:tubulin beta